MKKLILFLLLAGQVFAQDKITDQPAITGANVDRLNDVLAIINVDDVTPGYKGNKITPDQLMRLPLVDLAGDTTPTLVLNSKHFDTIAGNTTVNSLPAGVDGDEIIWFFNVSGGDYTIDFHTNSTVYRLNATSTLAAALQFEDGYNYAIRLTKLDGKWWIIDSAIDFESANTFYAGPSAGGDAAPIFRALVTADIPTIPLASGVSGTLPVANGGTGATTLTGVLKGNGTSAFTAAARSDVNTVGVTGNFSAPTTTNPYAPAASLMYGGVFFYGATGEIDLPAGATGMNFVVYNTGAFTITIDPNASEAIVRDGTLQTGGVSFTLSSGAGNYVALLWDGSRWVTLGYKGTLAVGS